ncbi:MAG TPA: VOC family protein [Casimicrobiaceae bacterium]|nr:VOC family protein [Casimicrobiaceae bacterium]
MARVLGFGGLFFKSPDPGRLLAWYAKWLGFGDGKSSVEFAASALPPRAFTVWSPFPGNTDYFRPSTREFMFNLIVDDLDGALGQVHLGGAQVVGEVEEHEYGRFGWFVDPDGNKVELWEPPGEGGETDVEDAAK